jgi:hypothetical protein
MSTKYRTKVKVAVESDAIDTGYGGVDHYLVEGYDVIIIVATQLEPCIFGCNGCNYMEGHGTD